MVHRGLIIGEAETEAETGTTPATIHLNVVGPPPFGLPDSDLTAVVTGGEGLGVAWYAEWFSGAFNDTAAYPSISPLARIADTGFTSWTPTSGTAVLPFRSEAIENLPDAPFYPIPPCSLRPYTKGPSRRSSCGSR